MGDIQTILFVLVVGMVSGFVNVVGGGGSLISLPVLIAMGLPAAVANGTNRVALMVQSIVAIGYFQKKGYFYPRLSIVLGIPAVLGSIVGARFAIALTDEMFTNILIAVMVIVAILIIWRPEKYFIKDEEQEEYSNMRLAVAAFVFFGVGFYGGFIQAGVGFIVMAALVLITGMSLVKVNSIKVLVTAIYMLSSLLVFVYTGNVEWGLGFALAAGNAIGAYGGSAFVVAKGDKWIRIFLVVSIFILAGVLLDVHKYLGF